MKNTLIATLFVLSILPAIGQDITKANYMGASVLDSFSAKWVNNTILVDRHKPAVNRDTIRVVMLMCDTTSSSWVDSGIVKGKLVQIGEEHKHYRDRSAIWAYGYSVREYVGNFHSGNGSYLIYTKEPFYKHIEYLGEDKKPLFNKIVWVAKEVWK